MSALVSLIMPAWNPRPDWLREAVASALTDDGCDLELIVVDDESTHPVAQLLEDVDDERLRVQRIDHAGPYAARNAGLSFARGDFVRFIDSDDIVESGSTTDLLRLAQGEQDVIAYGATLMCDESLRPLKLVECELEGRVDEACALGSFAVFHVSMLFPRAVVDAAGGWPEVPFRVSGDWDFVLRALEHGHARKLDAVVTRYRRHRTSVMSGADIESGGAAAELVISRYLDRHPQLRGSRFERRAYGRMHLDRAADYAWRGERRRAVEQLLRGARLQPAAATAAAVRLLVARWQMSRDVRTTPARHDAAS